MTDINGILSKCEAVQNRIGQMLSEKEHASEYKKNLLAAYTDIALEHHASICLLVNRKLYGSSFALVRPLFEIFYRAHWVCGCATGEQIQKICNNDNFKFPKMSDMVKSLDVIYASGDTFFSDIKDNSWSSLCSYTHTGLLSIGRRFTGNTISPNYRDGEILEVLNSINVIILLVARLFFLVTNQTSEVEEIEKILVELRQV